MDRKTEEQEEQKDQQKSSFDRANDLITYKELSAVGDDWKCVIVAPIEDRPKQAQTAAGDHRNGPTCPALNF